MSSSNTNKVIFRFVSISFSILILLVISIGVFKGTAYCYDFGYRIFTEKPVSNEPGREIVVQVSSSDSVFEIGELLESKGLIRDSLLYAVQGYLFGYEGEQISGTYILNTSMTTKEMMIVMSTPVEDTEVENE